jgi:hypothetical protein
MNLGMTVPSDNTPEKFVAFMRSETARQSALARLSRHQKIAPQRLLRGARGAVR